MSRVVAIRLRQMGDVIVTLGALREMKRVYPSVHLSFMVDAHFHPLLQDVDYIDELLTQPPSSDGPAGLAAFFDFVDDLRATAPDCIIDFHSNPRSALFAFLAGAPRRAGFDVKLRKLLYTDVEPRVVHSNGMETPRTAHEAAVALCARVGFGGLAGTVANTIPVSEAARARGRQLLVAAGVETSNVIALNPGKPYPAKSWPEEYFVGLAKRLAGEGRRVVVCWGPGEREAAARIADAAGKKVYIAPETRLGDVPGMIVHFDALVGIDSGLKHLCVATGVPTVTLFGPTSPAEWHMGGERDIAMTVDMSCSPCRLMDCPFGEPCMRRLTPDDVLDALNEIGAVAV